MRLTLVLAVGCTGEQSFPERFVDAYCDDLLRCEGEAFDVLFYDLRDCREALLPEQVSAGAGCGYDPDAGRTCLSALADRGCAAFSAGEWTAACDGVWDCAQK